MGNEQSTHDREFINKCAHEIDKCSIGKSKLVFKKPVYKKKSQAKNYFSGSFSKLNELRKCDMKICHETKSYPCHSIVLMNRSPYFERLVIRHFNQYKKGYYSSKYNYLGSLSPKVAELSIDANDISPKIIEDLLSFMYLGRIDLPKDDVEKIMEYSRAANKWDLWLIANDKRVSLCSYSLREATLHLYNELFTPEEMQTPCIHILDNQLEENIKKKFSIYEYFFTGERIKNADEYKHAIPFNFCISLDHGEKVWCHRELLVTFLDYFHAMLTTPSYEEYNKDSITLRGVTSFDLKFILKCMYVPTVCGKEITKGIAAVSGWLCRENYLFHLAEQQLIQMLNYDNCLELKCFAEMHSFHDLYVAACHLSYTGLNSITSLPSFQDFSKEAVCDYLSSDKLFVLNEVEVFHAFLRWGKCKRDNDDLYHVFKAVMRLSLLRMSELEHIVMKMLPFPDGDLSYLGKKMHKMIQNDLDEVCDAAGKWPMELRMSHYGQSFRNCCKKCVVVGGASFHIYGMQQIDKENYTHVFTGDQEAALILRKCCTYEYYGKTTQLTSPRYLMFEVTQYGIAVFDNMIYITGGKIERLGSDPITKTLTFDPLFHVWKEGPPLLEPRFGHSMVAVGHSIYVIGGYRQSGVAAIDIERLQFGQTSWTVETIIADAASFTCAVWKDVIYLFCRNTSNKYSLLCYSTKLRTWFKPIPLFFPHGCPAIVFIKAITCGHDIYVFGEVVSSKRKLVVSLFSIIEEKWLPCIHTINAVGIPFEYNKKFYIYLKDALYDGRLLLRRSDSFPIKIKLLDIKFDSDSHYLEKDLVVDLPCEKSEMCSSQCFDADSDTPYKSPAFLNLNF
ncbi:ectoderm-neural cortex protein 1-like isoform X2 [Clavelina lepadiformis]|uniref:ectoderm-neural cortex protein 1-like isoform X2 n=1 Tax=Clavelina lepadiformis TaxID=159417 RepID=UPI004041A968